jgi:hypothetical protein
VAGTRINKERLKRIMSRDAHATSKFLSGLFGVILEFIASLTALDTGQ